MKTETITTETAAAIISGFITLKKQEKDVKLIVELNKRNFIESCDTIANGRNQIDWATDAEKNVLLYTIEKKKYEYSKTILALEKELKAAKEKFESKNDPIEVTRCWAVKF